MAEQNFHLSYRALTPFGPTEEVECHVDTTDVGEAINFALARYEELLDVKISRGRCVLCNRA